MNEQKKKTRIEMLNLEEMQKAVANSSKGRKTLVESGKEERTPFTTTITNLNRERLGIYALKNRKRMSDVLDEILNTFFEKKEG